VPVLIGAHGRQPNAALAESRRLVYLHCRRSGPGALSREPVTLERLGELNKGDVMKALVVAMLKSLSSAFAADARDSRQRGNLR